MKESQSLTEVVLKIRKGIKSMVEICKLIQEQQTKCLLEAGRGLSGETRADSEEEVACGMGRLGRVRVEVEGSRERTQQKQS